MCLGPRARGDPWLEIYSQRPGLTGDEIVHSGEIVRETQKEVSVSWCGEGLDLLAATMRRSWKTCLMSVAKKNPLPVGLEDELGRKKITVSFLDAKKPSHPDLRSGAMRRLGLLNALEVALERWEQG